MGRVPGEVNEYARLRRATLSQRGDASSRCEEGHKDRRLEHCEHVRMDFGQGRWVVVDDDFAADFEPNAGDDSRVRADVVGLRAGLDLDAKAAALRRRAIGDGKLRESDVDRPEAVRRMLRVAHGDSAGERGASGRRPSRDAGTLERRREERDHPVEPGERVVRTVSEEPEHAIGIAAGLREREPRRSATPELVQPVVLGFQRV